MRIVTFIFTALLCAAFVSAGELERFEFNQPQMGTTFRIVVYAPDNAAARAGSAAAFERIGQLNKMMSDYIADSELMLLCAKSGGEPVRVSRELFEVLSHAQKIAEQTDGAFDVTIGPLIQLWRASRKTKTLPSADELARARALSGWKNMTLDANRQTVQLAKAGMRLDLGGIAKGYAADKALDVLKQHGMERALIVAGGDIRAGAPPPEKDGWTVGIAPLQDPERTPSRYLLLRDAAVSTAGGAEQFVEIGGTRYSHIIDPRTGLGRTGHSSVTVYATQGMIADALDTAVNVLGADAGVKLIDSTAGTAALILSADAAQQNGEHAVESRGWRDVPKTQAKNAPAAK